MITTFDALFCVATPLELSNREFLYSEDNVLRVVYEKTAATVFAR